MVAECKAVQDASELQGCSQVTLGYAEAHKKVIDRWGTYPHRNKILGRSNTVEEEQEMEKDSIPKF